MARSRAAPPPLLSLPPLPHQTRALAERALGDGVLPRAANAGLVWDRYARVWSLDASPARSEQRSRYLQLLVAAYNEQRAARSAELGARVARLSQHLPEHRDFQTQGRLVTGLGAEHAVENGFTFDHTLGVPVVPGSSLKGLCRAAAHLRGAPSDLIERLLGSEPPGRVRGAPDQAAPLKAGAVVFHAALPVECPALEVDLLNPHHPAYYADQGRPSGERTRLAVLTEEPVPVAFLVVARGARFRVWLRGRGGQALAPADTEAIWTWLAVGLEALGAGGKTAAGYGAMIEVPDR